MQNDWKTLSNEDQIDQIITDSNRRPQLIYKHSNRCPVCSLAYRRLRERDSDIKESADIYYLDVISSRQVSNAVADHFGVIHESPQLLIVSNGKVIWHESHYRIQGDAVLEALKVM